MVYTLPRCESLIGSGVINGYNLALSLNGGQYRRVRQLLVGIKQNHDSLTTEEETRTGIPTVKNVGESVERGKTTMDLELFMRAIVKLLGGVLLLGLLLFLPAGTLHWWQGWLLMGILFIPMFIAGLVMMKKSPELLKKRLNAREEQDEQKQVILLSGLVFLAAFVVAGLNFRFHWIVLPDWVSWAFAGVFLSGYALYAEVLRENEWLSRTVEVQEGQSVVDTGLYGVVRHPMYMSTLVLFLSMPLVLGSVFSFVIMLAYIPIIGRRIRNEERVLEQGLAGYADYKRKVRWKVIPHVW